MSQNQININFDEINVIAELNNSQSAQDVIKSLPFQSKVNIWGDEIYFEMPVTTSLSPNAKTTLDIGDIAFWPSGKCFCLFFGPTPFSTNEQPIAAAEVNVIGKFSAEDIDNLKNVKQGSEVSVKIVEPRI